MTTKKPQAANNVHPLKIADADRGIRHVFIRDYITGASIGAYDHEEKEKVQNAAAFTLMDKKQLCETVHDQLVPSV